MRLAGGHTSGRVHLSRDGIARRRRLALARGRDAIEAAVDGEAHVIAAAVDGRRLAILVDDGTLETRLLRGDAQLLRAVAAHRPAAALLHHGLHARPLFR